MTKIHAEVLKLRNGAAQALKLSRMYGQSEAALKCEAQHEAYNKVLELLGDPQIVPSRWKKLICNIFHQKHSLKCPNCGGVL